jgi:hypothetical protein
MKLKNKTNPNRKANLLNKSQHYKIQREIQNLRLKLTPLKKLNHLLNKQTL